MASDLVAEEFLQTALEGDATLAALFPGGAVETYWGEVPDTSGDLYIVIAQMYGQVVSEVAGHQIMLDEPYEVKVEMKTESWADLEPVYARVHELLNRYHGTTATGAVIACVRESVIKQSYSDQDNHYLALGGIYRIQSQ